MLPQITVRGRLTADPELRFTPSGKAVCNFTIAASERRKNPQTDEWEDGDKCFLRFSFWNEIAENICESLLRGQEVVATGQLYQRDYETKEGEKRIAYEVKGRDIAAAVSRNATVRVSKIERGTTSEPASDDPWGSAAPPAGDHGFTEEPPF
jgi:single-strand DNA-binding protein